MCYNILHAAQIYYHAIQIFGLSRRLSEAAQLHQMQEVDDVLGGAAAWENVDSTDEQCPKCCHPRAYFMQIQTRSADEPMTTFYKCCNTACGHRWRD
jgi:DNA-directed RNA polymerase III subunit RPC11